MIQRAQFISRIWWERLVCSCARRLWWRLQSLTLSRVQHTAGWGSSLISSSRCHGIYVDQSWKTPFEEIRGYLTQITEYKLVWLQEGEALEEVCCMRTVQRFCICDAAALKPEQRHFWIYVAVWMTLVHLKRPHLLRQAVGSGLMTAGCKCTAMRSHAASLFCPLAVPSILSSRPRTWASVCNPPSQHKTTTHTHTHTQFSSSLLADMPYSGFQLCYRYGITQLTCL